MNVAVLFFGQLREIAGTRQEVISMRDGARLFDLLERLGGKYGTPFCEEVGRIENYAS